MDAQESWVNATGLSQDAAMSPMEVAEYLGVGRTMVYTLLSTPGPNRLKSYKIGKRRIVLRRHVDEWFRRQEYDPANDVRQ